MNSAKFIEDIQNSGSQLYKDFIFKEEHIVIPITIVSNDNVVFHFKMKIQFYPYKLYIKFILK